MAKFEDLQRYSLAGFRVMPINGKEAFWPKWQENTTPQQLTEDDLAIFPDNFGVILGADHLVIDVDPQNFPEGRDVFAEFLAAVPGFKDICQTVVYTRGGPDKGGAHYYFKRPDKGETRLPTKLKAFPGIDIRRKGHYVVGAGSIHPQTGAEYLILTHDVALGDVPAKLWSMILAESKGKGAETSIQGGEGKEKFFDILPDYRTMARAREMLSRFPEAIQGQNGDLTTFRAACVGPDLGIPKDMFWPLLLEYNAEKCHPSWTLEDLKTKWLSAYKNRNQPVGHLRAATEFEAVKEPAGEAEPIGAGAAKKPIFATIEVRDLIAKDIPPRKLLLSPWLTEQSLSMIYASRGVGKTFVALHIAAAIAGGAEKDILGWRGPALGQEVLFVDGEMPLPDLQGRLKTLMPRYEPMGGTLHIMSPDMQSAGMPNLATKEGRMALEGFIGAKTKLVVLDNLSTLVRGGVENDAESWDQLQDWLISLRSRGLSVLLVHHAGKSGEQRGTSKREDVLDTVISLKHPEEYSPEQGMVFDVVFEKARGIFGGDTASVRAEYDQGLGVWITQKAEEMMWEKFKLMMLEKCNMTEICEVLNLSRPTYYRWKNRLKSERIKVAETDLKGDWYEN